MNDLVNLPIFFRQTNLYDSFEWQQIHVHAIISLANIDSLLITEFSSNYPYSMIVSL